MDMGIELVEDNEADKKAGGPTKRESTCGLDAARLALFTLSKSPIAIDYPENKPGAAQDGRPIDAAARRSRPSERLSFLACAFSIDRA